jgi:predicted ATP-grasp superfamily ATP-dependent carboligase
MTNSEETVLITGARAPVAMHLARLFYDAGRRVVMADSLKRPISSASSACAAYHRIPSPRYRSKAYVETLTDLLRAEGISLVVPTCEETFYLAQIWRDTPMSAELFSAPIELLTQTHDKHAFIRLVEGMGQNVPETNLLSSSDDLDAVKHRAHQLVFKPVWSRFANRVLLRPRGKELSVVKPTPSAPWVAQAFIEGEEISAYVVAVEGTIKAISLYRLLYRAGKGAGICIEPVANNKIREFVESFIKTTSWTGQLSFDFIRGDDGRIWPLECNPRATSGVHFFRQGSKFVSALIGEAEEVPIDVEGRQGVRLAMLYYCFHSAVRGRTFRRFWKDWKSMGELFDWSRDSVSYVVQLLAVAEIAKVALRYRISLQKAATRDIEWNGPI